jgi:hypothetical protein
MRTRITTLILAVLTALAMMAAPASAHIHANAKGGGGFIGPNPAGPGGIAHNGIECAAAHNPNIDSIPAFTCPAGG